MQKNISRRRRLLRVPKIGTTVERLEPRWLLTSEPVLQPLPLDLQTPITHEHSLPDFVPQGKDGSAAELHQSSNKEQFRRENLGLPIFGDTKGRVYFDSTSGVWKGSATIARQHPDGTVDASFGEGGMIRLSATPSEVVRIFADSNGSPGYYWYFVYDTLSQMENGNLLFTIRSYWLEDRYVLSEDGGLLSSESNNGWLLGQVQFSSGLHEASPHPAAARSDAPSISDLPADNAADSHAGRQSATQASELTHSSNVSGLIGVRENLVTDISDRTSALRNLLDETAAQRLTANRQTQENSETTPRSALMPLDDVGLAIDQCWVDLSLGPITDFCEGP